MRTSVSILVVRAELFRLFSCYPERYANEVGEAFRALAPVSAVWATRAVATVYVSADALDKGKKAAVEHGDNPGKRTKEEPRTCPSPYAKWTAMAIGLSTIPFIIHPIDRGVDFLLDSSRRTVSL
ncbi:mitochondrial fission process protein 1-like isoform X1 [Oncorhynchus tshawytscha]|uniref:mitochondrial fission process protein 1-like isoform X1 n=1 Tax=Oncorhynchus tshawytscha TaxID=74940 RepID=UPI000D0A0706|nr:mitochondrial fission process protein 1-like isoform X1 [Oncorhynchus tshawytscha]